MDQECLRRCQLVQLEIANEIKRICESNCIHYSLIAGSMLGAVRHKGFIPWDDDLDIGMARKDFEKFIDIASKELKEDFFLQTWDTDNNFALPIAKIRKKHTRYVERNSSNVKINDGIYIDIFPFDNVPDNKMAYILQKYKSKILLHLLLNKNGYDYLKDSSGYKIILGRILRIISGLFSLDFLHEKMKKCMDKYNRVVTRRMVTFAGANRYEKETIQRTWLDNTMKAAFENTEFEISQDWQAYLEHFYGDFMTPPSIEHRFDGHSIILVEFENGDKWESTNTI